jgi:hypothetical protein
MYERTETGEVIASVIKNGVPKPNPLGGGGGVSMAVSAAASAAMAIQRGRPPAVEPQRPHVASYVAECTLPPDCPITEDNVESVLDRSIAATQTMRRTLTNLKDDLRRMGGGPTVTPALRPIHMQHRVDVACKLANAFVEYRDLIARISNEKCVAKKVANNENALPVKDGGSTSTSLTTTTASNSSATSSDAFSGGSKQGSMPVPRSTTARRKEHSAAAATVAAAPVSARPVVGERLPSKAEQKSRRKAAAPVSSTHKRKATTEVESIVSDDLWMSCEPCD